MIIQWCLKGIPETGTFGTFGAGQVIDILSTLGLMASWVRDPANSALPVAAGWAKAHADLSDAALAAHVNAHSLVGRKSPYISMTAGVVERDPVTRQLITHSPWKTALDFATDGGHSDGYVFECWVSVPFKPGPELPGFAEEVRDLNLHRYAAWWHHEGEIAAKLVVPPRQIRRVRKYSRSTAVLPLPAAVSAVAPAGFNPAFVPPERLSNIRDLV